MKQALKTRAAVLLIFTILLVPALASAAVKAVPPDGPYPAGVRILTMEYPGKKVPVIVWYPAQKPAGKKPHVYMDKLQGAAYLDALPEGKDAPYPLIMFSHGMGGCGWQSVFYTENLASWGYVVAAPDHDDSAMCHIDRPPDITTGQIVQAIIKSRGELTGSVMALFGDRASKTGFDFSYRPAEAKAVIDQALAWNQDPNSFLHGMIAPDKIGVTGHSLGGYTTLMLGGVPFRCDPKPLPADQCNLDPQKVALEHPPNPCCLESVRKMDPYQNRDPRVKAILALGPAVFFPDLATAAADLKIPVMVISGDNVKMEVPWQPIQTLYDNAPAPKYAVKLKATDHLAISDVALSISAARFVLPGFRSHFPDKAQAYKQYSAAFFNLYLKGDASGEKILRAPINNFVELQYKEPGP